VKVFKRCCTFSAVEETDDDMLWNDMEKVGKVSECEEGEVTDCEDRDSDTDW